MELARLVVSVGVLAGCGGAPRRLEPAAGSAQRCEALRPIGDDDSLAAMYRPTGRPLVLANGWVYECNCEAAARPTVGGGAAGPTVGGGAAGPTVGGGAAGPSVGGGAAGPSVGGGAERPSMGGGAERPSIGGGAERPSIGGAAERPSIGGGAEAPLLTCIVQHPCTGFTVSRSVEWYDGVRHEAPDGCIR